MSEKATYTHGHHQSVTSAHARRTVEDSAAFLVPHIQPHHKILDLGCGPGSITIGLAKLVPQGYVIGGDSVASVLDSARSLAAEQGVHNLEFQVVDGNKLPFADGEFDVVFAHQVLQHVGDPVGVMREMKRVVKKCTPSVGGRNTGQGPTQHDNQFQPPWQGGILAVRDADYRSFAWHPSPAALDRWGELYQQIAKANGAEPNAGRFLPFWARQAGWTISAVDDSNMSFSWGTWLYDREKAVTWGQSWKDRALHSAFASTSIDKQLTTRSELEGISRAWEEWAGVEGRFIVIPNGEVICRV